MADCDNIRRLFNTVLDGKIRYHQLDHAAIKIGIQNMKEVYKPNPTSLSSEILDVADYNDPAHRCAYLHKYAPLHTALVSDMLSKSMQQVRFILQEILADTGRLEVCSLGGGPGSDILGVISVLSAEFGFFQLSATIIDFCGKWRHTFGAIIRELRGANYGFISDFVQPQYFNWNYIGHNLLGKMSNDVNKAIHGANLITMVKFVSAAACKDTAEMIKKIFRSLKPGALVLFIDNDAGGFYRLVAKGSQECNMVTVFGPLIHEHYTNMNFNVQRFGYTPCLETTVTVHMWMKPNYGRPDNNQRQKYSSNPRRQNTGNRSSYDPVQRQPQYRQFHDINNDNEESNNDDEENDMGCNCCIDTSETNNAEIPLDNRRYSSNQRRRNTRNRSSHNPVQRQPQYRRFNDTNNDESNNYDEENDMGANCCVIS